MSSKKTEKGNSMVSKTKFMDRIKYFTREIKSSKIK